MTEKEEKAIAMLNKYISEHKFYNVRQSDNLESNIETVIQALEQRINNQKIFVKEYEKISKQLNCEVKDNLEKAIALEQKDKEIQELKKYDIRNIKIDKDKIISSPSFTRKEVDLMNLGIALSLNADKLFNDESEEDDI